MSLGNEMREQGNHQNKKKISHAVKEHCLIIRQEDSCCKYDFDTISVVTTKIYST